MSCCPCFGRQRNGSTEDANPSNNIESELKKAGLKDDLNIKVLILGSGESGKSTVLKQIKNLNKIALTDEETQITVASLRRNAIQCLKILIEQARNFDYKFTDPESKEGVDKFDALDLDDLSEIGPEFIEPFIKVWKDNAIQQAFGRKNEYWILEAAEFFCSNFERFIEPEFLPTEEDMIMARVMTVGIIKTDFSYPPLQITLVDVGGQRNERRKWIHCFDNVNAILFICNLAGYNTVLFEDSSVNRMAECLSLFKQTVNNPVFEKTPFYLLFNKKDMFEEKTRKDPITVCQCFKDYAGDPTDTAVILKFVDGVFREQIQSGDPKRLLTFSIAARFKRDVKTCWDDILADIRLRYKTQINNAVKQLTSLEKK